MDQVFRIMYIYELIDIWEILYMCLCAHTYIYKSKLMSLFLLVSQVTAGATLPHQLQYIYPREQD